MQTAKKGKQFDLVCIRWISEMENIFVHVCVWVSDVLCWAEGLLGFYLFYRNENDAVRDVF